MTPYEQALGSDDGKEKLRFNMKKPPADPLCNFNFLIL